MDTESEDSPHPPTKLQKTNTDLQGLIDSFKGDTQQAQKKNSAPHKLKQ